MRDDGLATTARSYESVAWFYQRLAHLYSGGEIRAAKASQVSEIRPRDKVLHAGVGSGEDAVLAAGSGAEVTCVDLSPRMVRNTRHAAQATEGGCEDQPHS